MKSILIASILLILVPCSAQNLLTVYSDSTVEHDYVRHRTLELFDDSTYSYNERTDWSRREIICHYALIGDFTLKGKLRITHNPYILKETSAILTDNEIQYEYFLRQCQFNRSNNKITIKLFVETTSGKEGAIALNKKILVRKLKRFNYNQTK